MAAHHMGRCALGRTERLATSLRRVRISRADWDELVAHAREEAPNECCGYLRAREGVVEEVFRAVNKRALALWLRARPRGPARGQRARRRRLRGRHLPLAPAAARPSHRRRTSTWPTTRTGATGSSRSRASPRCACGGSPTGRSRRSPLTSSELVCPGCGADPDEGAAFCAHCGMPLVTPGRRAARRAAQRRPRARAQDRPALHRGRARARGRRPQPGRGGADPGPAARGGRPEHPAPHRGLRRARLPGRRAARRARARGRRGGRPASCCTTRDWLRPPGAACARTRSSWSWRSRSAGRAPR